MALGTGAVTPLQLAGAYSVFANGGYRIKPYLIQSIVDGNGAVILEASTPQAPQEANRVITGRNAFVIDSMLRDVTRFGTAAASAKQLGRTDLAGKTGTTNDAIDGWFAGYAGKVVAVSWMGYDEPRSLGGKEFGSTLAMPIWVDYMRVALAKVAPQQRTPPEDLVNDGRDWVYPEYADAVEVRTIDIALAPPPAPVDEFEQPLEAPPEGPPAIETLPQVAPPLPPQQPPQAPPPDNSVW